MTNDELQSQTINCLRFPLSVIVVFNHNFPWNMMDNILQVNWLNLTGMDIHIVICTLISNVVGYVASPCFFIFSGFLFFKNVKELNLQIYLKKIKRRVTMLMVPYVLWNIIPVVISAVFLFQRFDGSLLAYFNNLWEQGIFKVLWNYQDHGSYHNNIFGYPVPFCYPYNGNLWFLRDLIMLVFLSPVVYYFVKYTKLVGIVILGTCFFTQVWIYTTGFSIDAFFFFGLGAYFSIHGKNMVTELRKGTIIWLILAVMLMFLSMYYASNYNIHYSILRLFIITGVISTIIIASCIVKRIRTISDSKIISFLSKTSFFIFVTHMVFLMNWSQQLANFIFKSNSALFLIVKYFTAPIICVCICVGLYYVASKTVPKILKILTGSR